MLKGKLRMNHLTIALLILLLASSGSPEQNKTGSFPQNKSDRPVNWKLINACGATFYLPPDIYEVKAQAIDSCVRWYRGQYTFIDLDVSGGFSRPKIFSAGGCASERDFHHELTSIGGQRARISTCHVREPLKEAQGLRYAAVLSIPEMREDKGGNLMLWSYSATPEERERALRIFRSMRFSKD